MKRRACNKECAHLPTDDEFLDSLLAEEYHPSMELAWRNEEMERTADVLIANGWWSGKARGDLLEFISQQHSPVTLLRGSFIRTLCDIALELLDDSSKLVASVPVGLLPTDELNACAIRTPRGGSVIVLNQGVLSSLQFLIYSVMAIWSWHTEDAFDNTHTQEEWALTIIMLSFYVLTNSHEPLARIPTWDRMGLTDSHRSAITNCLAVELFILLHEYGHVILGHLSDLAIRHMKLTKQELQVYSESHVQEFEADEFAIRVLLDSSSHESIPSDIAAVVGPLFLFFDLCEQFSSKPVSGTHPKAALRWERVKQICGARDITPCPSSILEEIFMDISIYAKTVGLNTLRPGDTGP